MGDLFFCLLFNGFILLNFYRIEPIAIFDSLLFLANPLLLEGMNPSKMLAGFFNGLVFPT